MIKHSWPRRSGKTGAAIMMASIRGAKLYQCGSGPLGLKELNLPFFVDSMDGITENLIVDNYDLATPEEISAIKSIKCVEVFGTFGPDADDYRIPDADLWSVILDDVACGLIPLGVALRDFNITDKLCERKFLAIK